MFARPERGRRRGGVYQGGYGGPRQGKDGRGLGAGQVGELGPGGRGFNSYSHFGKDRPSFGRAFCKERKSYWAIAYPSPSSLKRAMIAFNEKTREIARKKQVILVDLEDNVPKDTDHFVDNVHYTTTGAERVASILAQFFGESKWWGSATLAFFDEDSDIDFYDGEITLFGVSAFRRF